MGINLRSREAHERSTAAMEGLGQVTKAVNQQGMMLDALGKMVYEIVQRQNGMEVVLNKLLEDRGLDARTIIEEHIASEQLRIQAEEEAGNATATEEATNMVGLLEASDTTATIELSGESSGETGTSPA